MSKKPIISIQDVAEKRNQELKAELAKYKAVLDGKSYLLYLINP